MSNFLHKSSSTADVVAWLRENSFNDEVINKFEDEDIDGKEFYAMEMWMIERLITGLKNIKRFRSLWSQVTNMGSWDIQIRNRMKKLQKQNRSMSSKRTLSMANADDESTPSVATKKKKNDHPWLDDFDQKGEELMQESISQLRKMCRAARPDHALVKDLVKKTYPLRRRMVLTGKETVESILKSFPPLAQPAHLRMEICRIFNDMEFCKNMKVCLVGTWFPRILSYVEAKGGPLFKKLMDEMEEAVDEGLSSETECRQRIAIWTVFHDLLRGSGGRKNSGSERVIRLLKPTDNVDEEMKHTVSPAILLCGESLFDTTVMYVVGDRKLLCDVSREDKLLDALILLYCVHYTYNYDYKVQRNAMIFFEKVSFGKDLHSKLPLSVTQTIKLLGQ